MLVSDINVTKCIEETIKLANKPFKKENEDKFGTYAPIYLAPTTNTTSTVDEMTKSVTDNALVMGSEGCYIFELLLKGFKNIDCFDKNILEYLYFEYTLAAIKLLPYEIFIENFTCPDENLKKGNKLFLHPFIFEMFRDALPENAFYYWYTLYDELDWYKALYSSLFRTDYIINKEFLAKNVTYYNKDKYERLQGILRSGDYRIDYHICDFDELHKEFKTRTYDLILYGNILQYFKSIPKYEDAYRANMEIKKNHLPMLNEHGEMLVCYGFEIPTQVVGKMLGLKLSQTSASPIEAIYRGRINEMMMKDLFIPQIVKKYDDYELKIIPGVELSGSDNCLLILKK